MCLIVKAVYKLYDAKKKITVMILLLCAIVIL
jgi:hypothetical protein